MSVPSLHRESTDVHISLSILFTAGKNQVKSGKFTVALGVWYTLHLEAEVRFHELFEDATYDQPPYLAIVLFEWPYIIESGLPENRMVLLSKTSCLGSSVGKEINRLL